MMMVGISCWGMFEIPAVVRVDRQLSDAEVTKLRAEWEKGDDSKRLRLLHIGPGMTLMQRAAEAAKIAAGWSLAKQDYARRIVGTK